MLALAWEKWALRAIVEQWLERLQRRRFAAGFNVWTGAAYKLRQRRGIVQRTAAWMWGRTLSAVWKAWADVAAAPAMDGEEVEEDPSQASNTSPANL